MNALWNKVVLVSSLVLSLGSGSTSFSETSVIPESESLCYTEGISSVEGYYCFDPSPDFPDECTSNPDVCDDAECDGFEDDIQAAGVGFYRYVTVDANGKKFGHQYYLCSCKSNTTRDFYARRKVQGRVFAASICKINEVQIPLPEDSTESCSDLNIYGTYNTEEEQMSNEYACNSHCNDVIFQGMGNTILALPEGEFGLEGVTSTSGIDHVCRCQWDTLTIEGCVTPDDYYEYSGSFIGRKFWVIACTAVATATTQMLF